jgi:hypothetical protein
MSEKPNGNGWKGWMLGVAGAIIAMLVALLFAVIERAYDHISDDHQRIFDRLQKLEMRR